MQVYPIKKLELEFNGIKNTILAYTPDKNISNFLNKLDDGIKKNDLETINYLIEKLLNWYKVEINEIHSNQFVLNTFAHDRNMKVLEEVYIELKDLILKENDGMDKLENKIFLSHNSKDKKFGDAIEKLLTSLGVKDEQLIYTSHPLHKIPLGVNIYEYLRNNIHSRIFMIFLWSNDYLLSPACLNEMGAAWVMKNDFVNIYTPDFNFNNPRYYECAVDTKSMGIVLNNDSTCKTGIIQLKDKIIKIFNLQLKEQTWMYNLDKFMEDIS